MILSTPPPEPTPEAIFAEELTADVEQKIIDQGGAGRYAITEFTCQEVVPAGFVCVSPWIHNGRTEYISGNFTVTEDGYDCHGWTVTDEPPEWWTDAQND